jgi:glutaredoxin
MYEIKETTLAMLNGCPHCKIAEIALKKANINYVELNWSNDENNKIFEELNIQKVPVLFIYNNGKIERLDGEDAIKKWTFTQR